MPSGPCAVWALILVIALSMATLVTCQMLLSSLWSGWPAGSSSIGSRLSCVESYNACRWSLICFCRSVTGWPLDSCRSVGCRGARSSEDMYVQNFFVPFAPLAASALICKLSCSAILRCTSACICLLQTRYSYHVCWYASGGSFDRLSMLAICCSSRLQCGSYFCVPPRFALPPSGEFMCPHHLS